MTHKTLPERDAEVQRIEEQIEYLDILAILDNPPPESRTGLVKHNADLGTLELYVYGQSFYEIDLDQCADHRQLVGWLRHLSVKAWATTDLLIDIMDAWSKATGKQVHGW